MLVLEEVSVVTGQQIDGGTINTDQQASAFFVSPRPDGGDDLFTITRKRDSFYYVEKLSIKNSNLHLQTVAYFSELTPDNWNLTSYTYLPEIKQWWVGVSNDFGQYAVMVFGDNPAGSKLKYLTTFSNLPILPTDFQSVDSACY